MTQVGANAPSRRADLLRRADEFQFRHDGVAYSYAVLRKFANDGSRQEAALVAYYAFFAILPLLLVSVSVLGLLLRSNVDLQARVLDSGLAQFPIFGDQLRRDVGSLDRTGLGLLVGTVLVVVGVRGLAAALQRAADSVWAVEPGRRPTVGGSVSGRRQAPALVAAAGGGLLVISLLTGFLVIGVDVPVALVCGGVAIAVFLNAAVLAAAFWLATEGRLATVELWRAAVPAAVAWSALQASGAFLLDHQVSGATEVGGFFAIVIGLMTWLYVGSLATLYSMQAQVVRFGRLWPRPIAERRLYTASGDPRPDADAIQDVGQRA